MINSSINEPFVAANWSQPIIRNQQLIIYFVWFMNEISKLLLLYLDSVNDSQKCKWKSQSSLFFSCESDSITRNIHISSKWNVRLHYWAYCILRYTWSVVFATFKFLILFPSISSSSIHLVNIFPRLLSSSVLMFILMILH